MQHRVVVTGFGLVTALGAGSRSVWEELLGGRSGVGPVRSFDTSRYPVDRGAEVSDFEPERYIRRLDVEQVGPAARFAIAAARLALQDAGLESGPLDPHRTGVSMGTTSGEPQLIEAFDDCWVAENPAGVGPEFMERYPCNMIPVLVASELGWAGVNRMIPSACAAGNLAIGYAYDAIRAGRADLMLAGGADSFSRITYSGFARLGAIAPDRCRPFDRDRRGMVPGEGAGMLLLETLSGALARGARIYAEVGGYGLSCDAHHMTSGHPEGLGAARAMRQALQESDFKPSQVSYISAHGTGTPTNDVLETTAVKRVFGKHAYRIPMSSVKSMLGHTMGAASAIEAAICALAVHEGRIPPTINLENPDPRCDLDYVPNRGRECEVRVAMNNAYAFGGTNASLILKKLEAETGARRLPNPRSDRCETAPKGDGKVAGQVIMRPRGSSKQRVVITGSGAVSPLGDSVAEIHSSLCQGKSALAPLEGYPLNGSGVPLGGELSGFSPDRYLGKGNFRPLNRAARLLAAAAELCLGESQCTRELRQTEEVGLVAGTMFCSLQTIAQFDRRGLQAGPAYVSPLDFANTVINAATGQVAIWHGLRGINATVAEGGSSGLQALGYAVDAIRSGKASMVLAGGVEELGVEALFGFFRRGLIHPVNGNGGPCPVPFQQERNGFALSEGAALLMLESEASARSRGVPILAEIIGHANTLDVSRGRDPVRLSDSIAQVMRLATEEAGTPLESIPVFSASANGSIVADRAEALAFYTVLGERVSDVCLTAPKAMLGESLGAAGALQVLDLLGSLRDGSVAGVPRFEASDPDLPRLGISRLPRSQEWNVALVNSIGCDGNCCSLVLSRV